jgi:uncharacterized protein
MVHVPARGGRSLRVAAGQSFRVVDLEGGQAGDLWAFCADDISEYLSAPHTRVHVKRLFPRVGEQFVTNRRRPILRFEEDRSPGVHDMLVAACDPARYVGLGVKGWHASCQENLRLAMGEHGFDVEVPQPLNLFANFPVRPDGTIELLTSLTKPGDYVQFRAEWDCYVVLSACPQDIVPIFVGGPSAMAIEPV